MGCNRAHVSAHFCCCDNQAPVSFPFIPLVPGEERKTQTWGTAVGPLLCSESTVSPNREGAPAVCDCTLSWSDSNYSEDLRGLNAQHEDMFDKRMNNCKEREHLWQTSGLRHSWNVCFVLLFTKCHPIGVMLTQINTITHLRVNVLKYRPGKLLNTSFSNLVKIT